ncbi:MAG: ATP-binding protein [Bacteroidota bacterium]|nr:ATP-binding protein [Bacteroidota bacterium]
MRFTPNIKYNMDDLERMIAKGEGVQLDFKQGITSQKKIARTISAFANNRGGKLLIGVKDNGELIGCDAEQEMYMVYEAAEHFCEPPVDITFTIYETEDEGFSILEAEVRNSLRKPHFAMDEKDEWQLYMRTNDKTMVASKSTHKMLGNEDGKTDTGKLDSKEQFVLDFLKTKDALTPRELSRRLNISLQRANVMLVKLTKLGLILYHKDGRGDYYMLR